jgi:hypothetical protein
MCDPAAGTAQSGRIANPYCVDAVWGGFIGCAFGRPIDLCKLFIPLAATKRGGAIIHMADRTRRRTVIMRKLLLVALVAVVASASGCQTLGNMFGGGSSKTPPPAAPVVRAPDPLLNPDIDEQQKYGRSRYAYPETDPKLVPFPGGDRPSPSGR